MNNARLIRPARPRGRVSLVLFLLLPLLISGTLVVGERAVKQGSEPIVIPAITVRPPVKPSVEQEESLWLARCIYSESKRPEEQELVAWVVRNRVESSYRGKTTYKRVILDPYQFSAFNPGTGTRRFYSSLNEADSLAGWQRAIEIARKVIRADMADRPFPVETRHFYSERSMPGVITPDSGAVEPDWAAHEASKPVKSVSVAKERFRFFSGVM